MSACVSKCKIQTRAKRAGKSLEYGSGQRWLEAEEETSCSRDNSVIDAPEELI